MFAEKLVSIGKLPSIIDFVGGGPPIFNLLLYFGSKTRVVVKFTGASISGTSCYFGQTLPVVGRHNAGKAYWAAGGGTPPRRPRGGSRGTPFRRSRELGQHRENPIR